jgi:NADPH-dependent 2,4-dienoyl-CoA reductase/sulfur reductase-like enzyme
VREAGGDAVEVHVAHGYVLSTFLSRADNRRTDRWGGTLENRARLAVEVVAAVRRAAGPDLAVLARLAGREFAADGEDGALTTDEAVATAGLLADAGADAIHVTGWGRNSFANFTEGPLPDTVGAYRSFAREIRAAVDVPVIAVGRVLPEVAEEMIAAGDCDFVAMGRQLLTDPELATKLGAGRRAQIRPCINCYVCVEQNFWDDSPRCAVNPALNAEQPVDLVSVDPGRRVVVVGGGPAGMEVARLAAERGHRVTLIESASRLGGTAWFSQLTTPANGPFVAWQAAELARLGVDVRLGESATSASVRALDPDVVVVATGAERGRPDISGAALPHVVTGDQLRSLLTGDGPREGSRFVRVLVGGARRLHLTDDPTRLRSLSRRWMPIAEDVVVLGGGLVGLELAEFLAERRRRVTVLEPGPALGLPMAAPRRWAAVRRAAADGVTLVRNAEVVEITPAEVAYRVEGEDRRARGGTVVVAGEVRARAPLATEHERSGIEVHVVGDAHEVGYIEGAIHSAWALAAEL